MNKLQQNIGSPTELEALYQEDAAQFKKWFKEAWEQNPNSETLSVWQARLNFSDHAQRKEKSGSVLWLGVLSLTSFLLVKLPSIFTIEEDWYYPRFVPFYVIGSLIAYFLKDVKVHQIRNLVIAIFFGLYAFMWLLPHENGSDSLIMSQLYSPFILISLLGVAFAAERWNIHESRVSFIRYLGEVLLLSTLILAGGIVLTMITFGLFSLIGLSIQEWYTNHVVVWGLVSAPLVATYLYDSILNRKSNLCTLLSNIFSPLFLITTVVYLIAILAEGKSPYSDREFLITFNGLLLVVWGITVFSVTGRKKEYKSGWLGDVVNLSLVSVTIGINLIALTAIAYRFYEFGVTPNRISVSGANLLIFVHLVLIALTYGRERNSNTLNLKISSVISGYLPAYTAWSIFVVVFLPLIFGFE